MQLRGASLLDQHQEEGEASGKVTKTDGQTHILMFRVT